MRIIQRSAALLLIVSAACGDVAEPGPSGEPTTLTVSGALSIFETEVDTVVAVVRDDGGSLVEDAAIEWTASATDGGVTLGAVAAPGGASGAIAVTGADPGAVTLTASVAGLSDELTLTVRERMTFLMPLGGERNQDWFVTNYVDAAEGAGIRDYACGPRSYDGHQGLDLVLPSFAAMDAGRPVLAAADGTVTLTHDGEFDRNKAWNSGVQWNVVVIDHGAGFEGVYGHLMKNSIRVQSGQAVQAGDTLGLAGSSGRSDMPHLHFEVTHQDTVIQTFGGGACGPRVGQWADAMPYQDAFHFIGSGLTESTMTLDLVKDPPPPADTVSAGSGTIWGWVHLHNVRVGDETNWVLRNPSGGIHRQASRVHDTFYAMSWWWVGYGLGDVTATGTWSMEFLHDGEVMETRSFVVTADGSVAAEPAGESSPIVGGGGIR